MQTTNTSALLDMLRDAADQHAYLQHADSRADLADHADWIYANLLGLGMTPAEISAAVPTASVFAA